MHATSDSKPVVRLTQLPAVSTSDEVLPWSAHTQLRVSLVIGTMSGLLSIIFALLVGDGVSVRIAANPSWWTYVPATISALAALAAVVVSLRLYVQGRTAAMREQVAKVYVEVRRIDLGNGKARDEATVHNVSDAPIWDVTVEPRRLGRTITNRVAQQHPDIAPRGEYSWSWEIQAGDVQHHERDPQLEFADNAGRRWVRVGRDVRLQPRRVRRQAERRKSASL
jgi:hypothetical protein